MSRRPPHLLCELIGVPLCDAEPLQTTLLDRREATHSLLAGHETPVAVGGASFIATRTTHGETAPTEPNPPTARGESRADEGAFPATGRPLTVPRRSVFVRETVERLPRKRGRCTGSGTTKPRLPHYGPHPIPLPRGRQEGPERRLRETCKGGSHPPKAAAQRLFAALMAWMSPVR